jgi:hypothetical protein
MPYLSNDGNGWVSPLRRPTLALLLHLLTCHTENSMEHAEKEFGKLVDQRLKAAGRQLKRKMDANTVEGIIKCSCEHFRQRIVPDFVNDGHEWVVDFDMPNGHPGFQQGRFKFSNQEILSCFQPSKDMVMNMLLGTLGNLHRSGL